MAAIDRRKIIEENKILQAFKAFDIVTIILQIYYIS